MSQSLHLKILVRSVILILSLSVGVSAQVPADQTLKVTLQDALDRARANSPQLLSATNRALAARQHRVQAQTGLLLILNYFKQSIYTPAADAQATTLARARQANGDGLVRYRVVQVDLQTLTGSV